MRMMVLVKAAGLSEKGLDLTSNWATSMMSAMGQFNDELRSAGIFVMTGGLQPTSQGKRLIIDGSTRNLCDGPFEPATEQVAGFWIWDVEDLNQAVAWAMRCPQPMPDRSVIRFDRSTNCDMFTEHKGDDMATSETITIEVVVPVSPERAWEAYTSPEAITKWNKATPDWHCPSAQVDLRAGGRHCARMEARDGSSGFDFEGTYEVVERPYRLTLRLDDDRLARTSFITKGSSTLVRTEFDPETSNSIELQRAGWQAILDSYAAYVIRSTLNC